MTSTIRPAARRDILSLFLYLRDHASPGTAVRFLDAVDGAISRIAEHPAIGAPKKLRNPRLAGLRRWFVNGFEEIGVYYLPLTEGVEVVRVLHGKRDIERILGS